MVLNRKIEDRSITALQRVVDSHPSMELKPYKCDKELCWDGFLRIYQNKNTLSDKKNYDDDIPIQIKGHVRKHSFKEKDRIKSPVNIDDLNNYYKTKGCFYFIVFLNEQGDESTIFYSSLYPSKIKEILEFANEGEKKRGRKSISVPFVQLPEDSEQLYLIAKQFSLEMNKQGSGRGQIVPNSIPFNDIKNASKITATIAGRNPSQILERFHTGDVVFYGKVGDREYPIQLFNASASISKVVEQSISINDIKYYSSYCCTVVVNGPNAKEYQKELTTVIKLSDNLSISITKYLTRYRYQFSFSPVSDLLQIGNDSRFLLALIESSEFEIGENHLKTGRLVIDTSTKKRLSILAEISRILEDIKCPIMIPYSDLTDDDCDCLSQLLQIKNKEVMDGEPSQLVSYIWWFRGKCCPVIVSYNAEGVSITNMISADKYRAFFLDDEKHPSVIPNFFSLNPQVLSHLLFYDYEVMFDQVDRSAYNLDTCAGLNEMVLNLISAFDINQDEKLLSIARLALKHLLDFKPTDVAFNINEMQIDYRVAGALSETQKEKLNELEKEISNSDVSLFMVFGFCKEVLLRNKEKATAIYRMFEKEERARIEGFPIMTLFHSLE